MRILYKYDLNLILDTINYNALNDIEIAKLKSMLVEDGEVEDISVERIKRYQSIIEKIKVLENNRCQIVGCGFTFRKKNGGHYSEAHHLIPLSDNGSQSETNVIILCPNHHRMFHNAEIELFLRDDRLIEVILNGDKFEIEYTRLNTADKGVLTLL